MTTRTVHIRLKDKTIAGCIDIYRGNGMLIENVPISTIISRTLDAIIEGLINDNIIPRRDPASVADVLAIVTDIKPALEVKSKLPVIKPDEDEEFVETLPTDSALLDRRAEIEQALKEIDAPKIAHDEVTFHEPTKPAESESLPITGQPRMTFDQIRAEAPKDRLVEAAEHSEAMQLAIAHVYSEFPSSLWGSDIAERNVMKILKSLPSEAGEEK